MNDPLEIPRLGLAGSMVRVLRPRQWTKNVLVFPALLFSYRFEELAGWAEAWLAFASFCFLSSAGYLINDIRDREADRLHPTKRLRPVAVGTLPVRLAVLEALVAAALGFGLAAALGRDFLLVALLYVATTLSYSVVFKHVVILDVMFLTAGFLWRAVAGAVAIQVTISPWLLLCASFGALFLGFNKRRGEIASLGEDAVNHRPNLADYNPEVLRDFQSITTNGTILSYALYTVLGSPTEWLLVTLPLVLYGVFRYTWLVDRGEGAAPDEILFRDRPILLTVILYMITAVLVLLLAPGAAI